MTRCAKTVEELSAYIDGELEVEEELALRRHLDSCTSCQPMTQIFAALKETVTRTAEVYPLPPTLRVALHVRPQPARRLWFSWTPFLKGGLITVLLFIAFAGGAGLVRQKRTGHQENVLARGLVAHHLHTISGSEDLGIASADPEAVAAWFQTQVSFPVRVSSLDNGRLLGGRVGSLLGQPVALVLYERDGSLFSLFSFPPGVRPVPEKSLQTQRVDPPECSVVFDNYAFCLKESEDVVHAVVTEGLAKVEEIANTVFFPLQHE